MAPDVLHAHVDSETGDLVIEYTDTTIMTPVAFGSEIKPDFVNDGPAMLKALAHNRREHDKGQE
jgi:hypothetical protein